MKDLDQLLKDSKDVEVDSYDELPDGEYFARIESVEVKTSKSGNLMFVWEFVLEDNEKYNNRHHWKYSMLTSPENMKRLTTDLNKFEVDTTSMQTIDSDMSKLLDVPVIIIIKRSTGKDGTVYTNTSVKPDLA